MARDSDTNTTNSTRPSTANTTSTTTTATSISISTDGINTSTNDARKFVLVQQTPTYPPPPPPQQQKQHQEAQLPLPVSASVPRSLWFLRRSSSSARSLALASTKEYVHAKLCRGGGLPSPSTPGKNLFPAPQQQGRRKKPIDIHDPEWLASHGLKWDARGLGLVSTAV